MDFVKSFNKLNMIVRLILTIFFDLILGAIYRIAKGRILIGIIWFFTGGLFGIGWIIDIVTTVTNNKYTFLT